MSSAAIVQKLWNYCNVLRDDGISHAICGIIMGENLQGWAIDHKELIYINNQTIPCLRIS